MAKRTAITIRFPDNLLNSLKVLSDAKGIPMNSLIVMALWDYIERNQVNQAATEDSEETKEKAR